MSPFAPYARAALAAVAFVVPLLSKAGEAHSPGDGGPSLLKSWSGYASAEVASAYLGSSGAIFDTRPVCSQELGWLFDLGEYGWIDGYFWTASATHNRQKESHRALFNEIETAICYGQSLRLAKEAVLKAKIGPLWNPPIGYYDSHQNWWGPYAACWLDNPFAVPYMGGLWVLSPEMRGRITFGLRRSFSLSDRFSVTPMVETVWMDRRRYHSRYGADPEDAFAGGSFATMTSGARFSWHVTDRCQAYCRLLMFNVIDSQARSAVRKQDAYYAKCDWPVFRIGVEYSF